MVFSQKVYKGKYNRIDVRFRSQFCYIDAFIEPHVPEYDYDPKLHNESREECIERLRNLPMHLCRLRYFSEHKWSMAFYTYSHEKYEPCLFNSGEWEGTPEEAFKTSAVYLTG